MKRITKDHIRMKIFNKDELDIQYFKEYGKTFAIIDIDKSKLPKDRWLLIKITDFEINEEQQLKGHFKEDKQ